MFVAAVAIAAAVVWAAPVDAGSADPGSGGGHTGAPIPVTAPAGTIVPVSAEPDVEEESGDDPIGNYSPGTYAKYKSGAALGVPVVTPAVTQQADLSATPSIAPAPALQKTWRTFNFTGWIPPDSHLAVGPSNMIAAVNSNFAIFGKTGTLAYQNTFSAFFGPSTVCGAASCPSSAFVFDPWVLYDRVGGRFIIIALEKDASIQQSRLIIAVSRTNSAVGSYCSYGINASTRGATAYSEWADYEKAGVTGNALITTMNMFGWGTGFTTAKVRVLWKSQLYACSNASYTDFWNLVGSPFAVQPATSTVNTATGILLDTSTGISTSSTTISARTLAVPGTPGVTPTLSSPVVRTVPRYAAPPQAVQPGTSTRLDTGDSRLLNAVQTKAGVFATGDTSCSWTGDSVARACVRFYELSSSTLNVTQAVNYGVKGSYFYYPSVAADDAGDAAFVFQRSSSGEYMSARYSGRHATATANTLQSSAPLATGQGCYVRLDNANRNRSGDYSGSAWDPSLGKFWLMAERATGTGSCGLNTWTTHVAEVDTP